MQARAGKSGMCQCDLLLCLNSAAIHLGNLVVAQVELFQEHQTPPRGRTNLFSHLLQCSQVVQLAILEAQRLEPGGQQS